MLEIEDIYGKEILKVILNDGRILMMFGEYAYSVDNIVFEVLPSMDYGSSLIRPLLSFYKGKYYFEIIENDTNASISIDNKHIKDILKFYRENVEGE